MAFKRVILVPYKQGSKAVRSLQTGLKRQGVRCFRKVNRQLLRGDLLFYYGGTDAYRGDTRGINLNRTTALNKLTALRCLEAAGLPTVAFTTDKEIAKEWKLIVARKLLSSHSGKGITIHNKGEELPDVKLYTQYVKKTYECRIHVFNGSVIDSQIKRKVRGYEDVNTFVRNHQTGWVYCRNDFTPTDECKQIAIDSVSALGLNFGAVDIIYNKHYNRYYVLEVNTAPGLEGTTLINYIKEIKKCLSN